MSGRSGFVAWNTNQETEHENCCRLCNIRGCRTDPDCESPPRRGFCLMGATTCLSRTPREPVHLNTYSMQERQHEHIRISEHRHDTDELAAPAFRQRHDMLALGD